MAQHEQSGEASPADALMNRRQAIAASLAVAGAAAMAGAAPRTEPSATQPSSATPEFYELRLYRFRRGPMQKRADDYFREALIPALRRMGTGPVGAFNVAIGAGNPATYLLIPHPSIESVAALPARLADDQAHAKAGAEFLAAPPTDPPHLGMESVLLEAFPRMPRLEAPPAPQPEAPRIFELRTYHSHGEPAAAKKVEMFEGGGEIAIFRRVGVRPVFFARGRIGPGLPSLTYLLTFPDLATREKNWNAFRNDPEWQKLRTTPGYTDNEIVSSIDNAILSSTPYSQI